MVEAAIGRISPRAPPRISRLLAVAAAAATTTTSTYPNKGCDSPSATAATIKIQRAWRQYIRNKNRRARHPASNVMMANKVLLAYDDAKPMRRQSQRAIPSSVDDRQSGDVDSRTIRSASHDRESEDCCCLTGGGAAASAVEECQLDGRDDDGDHHQGVGVVCIPAALATMKGPETPPKSKRTASNAHPDPAVTPWSSSTVRMSSDKMKSIMRFLDAVEAEQATTSIASSLNGVTATQDPKEDNNKQEKTTPVDGDDHHEYDDDNHNPDDPWRDSISVITSSTVTTSRHDLLSGCANGNRNNNSSSSSKNLRSSSASAPKAHDGIRAKVKWLKDELSEAKTMIRDLQAELDKARVECKQVREEAPRQVENALTKQKRELDDAAARQLQFIDRLIADKDSLAKKCAELTEMLKGSDAGVKNKVEAAKVQFQKQLRMARDGWAAEEKRRRAAWEIKKTAEIKDITIKGMEPEVQRMVADHRLEIQKLGDRHREAVKQQEAELAKAHEDALRQLRERLVRDREEAVERERLVGVAKAREAVERAEHAAEMQRLRTKADAESRLEEMERCLREELKNRDNVERSAKRVGMEQMELAKVEAQRLVAEAAGKHAQEIAAERLRAEGLLAEIDRLKGTMQSRDQIEAEIRQRCDKERDEQIELCISRLQSEADDSSAAAAAAVREELGSEIAALQTKLSHCESSLREVEGIKAKAEAQACESKRTLAVMERELQEKRDSIRWLETHVERTKEIWDSRELDLIKRNNEVERRLEDRCKGAEDKVASLASALKDARADLDTERQAKVAELEAVESRVKNALERKDEIITSLREKCAEAAARAEQSEAIVADLQREMSFGDSHAIES